MRLLYFRYRNISGPICIYRLETGSRRILHCNVTDHPTAEWTRQQFCSFLEGDSGRRYVIHARDSIFSAEVDKAIEGFDKKIPVRSPVANAFCERPIGTIVGSVWTI
jgi:putative transposase